MTARIARLVSVALMCITRVAMAQTPPPAPPASSDDVSANPARPTVSTPATLTPVGYLQFEQGVLNGFHSGEFDTRIGLNQVTKLTVRPRLQFIVSAEPVVWSHGAGEPFEVHAGGVAAGVQIVVHQGQGAEPTLAASYLGSVYSGGAPNLDLGSSQESLLLLFSNDLGAFHVDANFIFNDETDTRHHAQYAQTLSISRPVGPVGLVGEIWFYTQPTLPGEAIGTLWAVSYALSKRLVFDAGFDHGLTDTSTRWEAFAGFTYLLPHRLWK
jgi:hypothetical protein